MLSKLSTSAAHLISNDFSLFFLSKFHRHGFSGASMKWAPNNKPGSPSERPSTAQKLFLLLSAVWREQSQFDSYFCDSDDEKLQRALEGYGREPNVDITFHNKRASNRSRWWRCPTIAIVDIQWSFYCNRGNKNFETRLSYWVRLTHVRKKSLCNNKTFRYTPKL